MVVIACYEDIVVCCWFAYFIVIAGHFIIPTRWPLHSRVNGTIFYCDDYTGLPTRNNIYNYPYEYYSHHSLILSPTPTYTHSISPTPPTSFLHCHPSGHNNSPTLTKTMYHLLSSLTKITQTFSYSQTLYALTSMSGSKLRERICLYPRMQ